MAHVQIEFFGLARTRTGVTGIDLEASTLADVMVELSKRYPVLDGDCIQAGQLQSSWLFNVNGRHFTRDSHTRVSDGDHLLLMSADAGG